ncbi:MAG: hypothetical protein QGG74_04075 [Phycisphaerales bacterium]|jgi:hypothetical protein|nr:hypothetical protein [Phycisphaerales bacterium]
MSTDTPPLAAGDRLCVTQQMSLGSRIWSTTIEGELIRCEQAKTGSWFAASRDGRLWLDRLELRLDDGELVLLNLDQLSVVRRCDGQDSDGGM